MNELQVLLRLGSEVHALSTVDLPGDGVHLLLRAHGGVVDEFEIRRFFTGLDDLAGQLHAALAALLPHLGEREGRAQLPAFFLHKGQFRLRVQREAVDGHDDGQAVFLDVLDVLLEVGDARSKGLQVLLAQFRLCQAAMHLQRPDRRYHHHRRGN